MKKSRFTDAQITGILRQAEGGMAVPDLCREHGILAHQTLNPVKAKVESLSQNIMPGTSCSIGPVTGHEALPHDS